MNAMSCDTSRPETTRRRLLLMSTISLAFAVLGHLAFSQRWPTFWRIFEFLALLSAPVHLCLGLVELVRRQRRWRVLAAVMLSAIATLIVCLTLSALIHGFYWA
jgi:hypothetical protein